MLSQRNQNVGMNSPRQGEGPLGLGAGLERWRFVLKDVLSWYATWRSKDALTLLPPRELGSLATNFGIESSGVRSDLNQARGSRPGRTEEAP